MNIYIQFILITLLVSTIIHEKRIPEVWKIDKEIIIKWLNNMKDTDWGKATFNTFDNVIDSLVER